MVAQISAASRIKAPACQLFAQQALCPRYPVTQAPSLGNGTMGHGHSLFARLCCRAQVLLNVLCGMIYFQEYHSMSYFELFMFSLGCVTSLVLVICGATVLSQAAGVFVAAQGGCDHGRHLHAYAACVSAAYSR